MVSTEHDLDMVDCPQVVVDPKKSWQKLRSSMAELFGAKAPCDAPLGLLQNWLNLALFFHL